MKSVMTHQFSRVPQAEIQRSTFNRSHGYKTTFDAGYLIPVFLDEALPGDTFNVKPTLFARLNTPIYPIMDNQFLDLHFFSVPIRQIWENWRKFCGEQVDPGDSIDYTVPIMAAPASTGYSNELLQDYLGLPTKVPDFEHSALPTRAYNHIYNEWYRDQNLIDSVTLDKDDGPDTYTDYVKMKRGKRHDYFTSCLPWLQKGDAVEMPIGTRADIKNIGLYSIGGGTQSTYNVYETGNTSTTTYSNSVRIEGESASTGSGESKLAIEMTSGYPDVYADLSSATAATVNELRQAFQIQKLLEKDARAGTRYSELIKSHFGVDFLDVTYRPEFLGGSSVPINIQQIPQTSETDGTPQGTLAAIGTAVMNNGGFTKSFTEHCIVMGIASVRTDITYQQGLDRMWSRETRYDFYYPSLAHIGEQAILTKEIYCQDPTTDTGSTGTPDNERVFGYQERWAEYRYKQSKITGKLRSNDTNTLDAWHLSQEFTSTPELNQTFIEENPPMDRVVAVTSEPDFIMDCYFNFQCARPMPLYSVPGLIDHF
jgi:hypothetical protein